MQTDAAKYYSNFLEQMKTEKDKHEQDKIDQTDNIMDCTS